MLRKIFVFVIVFITALISIPVINSILKGDPSSLSFGLLSPNDSLYLIPIFAFFALIIIPPVLLAFSGFLNGHKYREIKLIVFSITLAVIFSLITLYFLFNETFIVWEGKMMLFIVGTIEFCIIYLIICLVNKDIYGKRKLIVSGIISILLAVCYTILPLAVLLITLIGSS